MLGLCKVIVRPLFTDFLSCRYPGGPIFNPLGFANDTRKSQPLRLKEIKNGKQSPSSTAREKVEVSCSSRLSALFADEMSLKPMLWGSAVSLKYLIACLPVDEYTQTSLIRPFLK